MYVFIKTHASVYQSTSLRYLHPHMQHPCTGRTRPAPPAPQITDVVSHTPPCAPCRIRPPALSDSVNSKEGVLDVDCRSQKQRRRAGVRGSCVCMFVDRNIEVDIVSECLAAQEWQHHHPALAPCPCPCPFPDLPCAKPVDLCPCVVSRPTE